MTPATNALPVSTTPGKLVIIFGLLLAIINDIGEHNITGINNTGNAMHLLSLIPDTELI
jgi:hypothetical protein